MEEPTLQRRLWKGAGVFIRSVKPLALYLCLPALLSMAGMIVFNRQDPAEAVNQSGNFYYAAGIILTLFLLHRASRKRGSTLMQETVLELHGLEYKKVLLLAVMGISFAVFFSALITVVPLPDSLMESYRGSSDGFREGNDVLLAWISVIVLAPAAEEIVFRGYMLGRLLEGFETTAAMVVSAFVFALCHVSLLWMIYAFLMGLLLAWVAVREDNLAYSIALHMGFNASVIPVQIINAVCGLEAGASGSGPVVILCGAAAAACGFWTLRQYRREKEA